MKYNIEMYSMIPSGKREYLMNYGEHFSRKAAEFAIKLMEKKDESGQEIHIEPKSLEEVDKLMSKYGIPLKNDKGYDKVYVAAMCEADYLGSSVPSDEIHMARFIRDYLDDKDGYEGRAFTEWYHKVLHTGTPVMWEDIM